MNWNHLYCFYEVAKYGSVKIAAKKIGLASSTISEHVKKLEDTHQLELLARKGRELVLTEEGKRIYNYAKKMFDTGLRLVDAMNATDVGGYTVKLAIESHLEGDSFSKFLIKYWDEYSEFGLVQTKKAKNLSQSLYFLEHDVVDLSFTTSRIDHESYDKLHIGNIKFKFFVSREVLKDFKKRSRADEKNILKELPLAGYGENRSLDKQIQNLLIEYKVSPKESFHSEHSDFLVDLCKQGKVALVYPCFEGEVIEGLEEITFERSISEPVFAMFKKSNAQLLFVRKLVELLAKLNIQSSDLSLYQFPSVGWKPLDGHLN